MPSPGAILQKALQQHQAGNFPVAEQIYRQILADHPRHADALHLLGVLEYQSGRSDRAVEWILRAVAVDARQAIFHNNLAAAYRALNRWDEAAASYRRALQLKPEYPDALSNLATVELARGDVAEALRLCRQALHLAPDFVEAHNNLGNALKEQGELAAAEKSYLRALELRPDFVLAHNNLGTLFDEQGRHADAQRCFEQALAHDRQYAPAWSNLGNILLHAGRHADARHCIENSLILEPCDGLRIKSALSLPFIYADREEISRERRRLEQTVSELSLQPLTVSDPVHEIGVTAMNAAYHGMDDRELQQSIAQLFLRGTPGLEFVAPHCLRPPHSSGQERRWHIGIISRHLNDHSNARLNAGIVRELPRDHLHVTLFGFPGRDDAMSRFVAAGADDLVALPTQLEAARQAIAARELDLLFYTDIGMEPLTYCLAFARLAPVQCTTWGVPGTTGIPNIDYFLSNVDLEPPEGDQHYTERLVKLSEFPTFYYRPTIPTVAMDRTEFGLPLDRHLYLCPQSLFKLHPEFDEILDRILSRDPLGEVVLIEGGHPHWTELLKNRLARSMPRTVHQVRFVPQLPSREFLRLLAVADVMLDPLHFGGGNTTFEALAFGTPIVTIPGAFLRSRVTYACYRKMNVLDAVARDLDQYVDLAVSLGTNSARREALRSTLRSRNGVLYENRDAIRELERFFCTACAAHHGELPTDDH